MELDIQNPTPQFSWRTKITVSKTCKALPIWSSGIEGFFIQLDNQPNFPLPKMHKERRKVLISPDWQCHPPNPFAKAQIHLVLIWYDQVNLQGSRAQCGEGGQNWWANILVYVSVSLISQAKNLRFAQLRKIVVSLWQGSAEPYYEF